MVEKKPKDHKDREEDSVGGSSEKFSERSVDYSAQDSSTQKSHKEPRSLSGDLAEDLNEKNLLEPSVFSENPLSPFSPNENDAINEAPESLHGNLEPKESLTLGILTSNQDAPLPELDQVPIDISPSIELSESETESHPPEATHHQGEASQHAGQHVGQRIGQRIGESHAPLRQNDEEMDSNPLNLIIYNRETPSSGLAHSIPTPLSSKILEWVLELNEKAKLKLDPQLLQEQAKSGKILLSLVPRYGLVWLCQKLAAFDVELEIKPSAPAFEENQSQGLENFTAHQMGNFSSHSQTKGAPFPFRPEEIPLFHEGDPLADQQQRPIHVESLIEILDHLNPEGQRDYMALYKALEKELLSRALFLKARGRTPIRSRLELVRPPFLYRLSLDCKIFADHDE